MAQGLLRAFQVAFPKSKHKFNEAFYRRLLRYMTQWTVCKSPTAFSEQALGANRNAMGRCAVGSAQVGKYRAMVKEGPHLRGRQA